MSLLIYFGTRPRLRPLASLCSSQARGYAAKRQARNPPLVGIFKDGMNVNTYNALAKCLTGGVTPVQEAIFKHHANAARGGLVDLLVKAQPGEGRSLAFLAAAIDARVASNAKVAQLRSLKQGAARAAKPRTNVGALVLAPSPLIATEMAIEARQLAGNHPRFGVVLINSESKTLPSGPLDIVVTTPPALLALPNSQGKRALLKQIETLIIDDLDTQIDNGYYAQLRRIHELLPPPEARHSMIFYAKTSGSLESIAKAILSNKHKFIDIIPEEDEEFDLHGHLHQFYTPISKPNQQIPHLFRLLAQSQLERSQGSKTIVFVPTVELAQLYKDIFESIRDTLPAGPETAFFASESDELDEFLRHSGGASVLFTSSMPSTLSRHPGVTHVVQVGCPPGNLKEYIHRLARTDIGGRGDLIVMPEEGNALKKLAKSRLQPREMKEVEEDVRLLAADYDHHSGPKAYTAVASRIAQHPKRIKAALNRVPLERVCAVFDSLLRFYLAGVKGNRKGFAYRRCEAWARAMGKDIRAPWVIKDVPLMSKWWSRITWWFIGLYVAIYLAKREREKAAKAER
ncbi:hypothetical protein BOTBODRAFT_69598 [Botryobasidium botryosum FD-172 SS1]|uniref:ATP-dependent RNA helicase n=1 Tax=Botryobasidium botryosum (strain FD-172 SS1) TaxID=930990 RepID=A0A067MAC0_BOTB1|nr:hypothetical protein BOTBODRAFT_69598 [Botryobasidium botryosum FD-172 SS1]